VPYGLARGGNARRTRVPIRASSAAGLRLDCSDPLPIFYPTHVTWAHPASPKTAWNRATATAAAGTSRS